MNELNTKIGEKKSGCQTTFFPNVKDVTGCTREVPLSRFGRDNNILRGGRSVGGVIGIGAVSIGFGRKLKF